MGGMDAICAGGDARNSPPSVGGAVRDEACKPCKDCMILAATGWLKADARWVVGGLCPDTSTPPPLTHFLVSTVSITSEVVGLSAVTRTVVPSKPCTSVNACSESFTGVPSMLRSMSSGYTRVFIYACQWWKMPLDARKRLFCRANYTDAPRSARDAPRITPTG